MVFCVAFACFPMCLDYIWILNMKNNVQWINKTMGIA